MQKKQLSSRQWRSQATQVQTLISIELSRQLALVNQDVLKRFLLKVALNTIDQLETLLDAKGSLSEYRAALQIFWDQLERLKLELLILAAIRQAFDEDCFFLKCLSAKTHSGCQGWH